MKRFYCTVCQKIKRVRNWPRILVLSDVPDNRMGECDWHKQGHIKPVRKEWTRPVTLKKNTPIHGRKSA